MTPKLSIIIVTLESRQRFFERLMRALVWQQQKLDNPDDVEFVIVRDNGEKSTGIKSNEGVALSRGDYVARFDDDDYPTDVYLRKQLDVAYSGADCGEFRGLYFLNGVYDRPFHHSIQYDHWFTLPTHFARTPNHLSCLKKELILDVPYPDQFVGEDGKMSEALFATGRLKKEYPIKETLYLYYDRTKQPGQ